jgi:hypothetical protein
LVKKRAANCVQGIPLTASGVDSVANLGKLRQIHGFGSGLTGIANPRQWPVISLELSSLHTVNGLLVSVAVSVETFARVALVKRQRFWRNYRWRYLPDLFQCLTVNFKGNCKVKGKVNR